jgi:tetratricopeptide (TPR) repeat protein
MGKPSIFRRVALRSWQKLCAIADHLRWLAVALFLLAPLPIVIWIHHAHAQGIADPIDLALDYLKATGVLLLVLGLFVAGHWLVKKQNGYSMYPLLSATSDKFNGQAVSEELSAELQKIRNIHRRVDEQNRNRDEEGEERQDTHQESPAPSSRFAFPGKKLQKRLQRSHVSEISLPQLTTQAAVGEFANFKVGDNSISLGRFFTDLKTFWRATDPKGTFSGSIRQYGDMVKIVMSFQGKLKGKTLQHRCWSADRTLPSEKDEVQVVDLIKELAFKIYHDIEDGRPPCETWLGLRHYTEAIAAWIDYIETEKIEFIDAATKSCDEVLRAEAAPYYVCPLLVTLAREHLLRDKNTTAANMCEAAASLQLPASEDSDEIMALAWLLSGIAEERLGQRLVAERSYRLAVSYNSSLEEAWGRLADLMVRSAREDEATVAVRRLGECLSKKTHTEFGDLFLEFALVRQAEQEYKAAIQEDSTNIKPLIGLGSLLADIGRSEEAIPLYETALKLEPNQAGTLNDLAIVYERLGKSEDAIRCYHDAIAQEPTNAVFYVNLGRVYLNNDPRIAHEEFQKALVVDPKLAWAYANLGFALHNMKHYQDAREAFELALRLGARYAEVHYDLASVYSSTGAIEDAINEYTQATVLAPDWAGPHVMLAQIYSIKNETEKAAVELKTAIARDPHSTDLHCRLGYIYRDAGRLDDAIAEFKIAQTLDPNAFSAYHGAGGTLQRMDRFSEAVDEYLTAIKVGGDKAYSYISLARCYEKLGQKELAEQARKTAVELGDDQIGDEYNRACYWALIGNRQRAIQLLSKAIASGEMSVLTAERDCDLSLLHGDPAFKALARPQGELGSQGSMAAAS